MRHGILQILLVAVLLPVTAGSAPAGPQPAARNVVLLSIDTLRADRLGCYGYPLDTSPQIDALADQGLRFEDCVCEVPLTAPSMGSMLTSRYPRMTGLTRNGLRMPEDVPTVAEQFKAAGYYTFCAQSNWTLKAQLSGLDRGFEAYDDDFHEKRWGLIKAERSADEVTESALRLLGARDPDRPFFAWVHYTDPHAPYKMHREFNPGGKRVWGLKNVDRVRLKYDSEVAFTDAEVGKLIAALPVNTAVLFTADHGESLYEHDYLGHGRRIYQTGLHIPLIIRAPGLQPGSTAVPARGIDVGPTLLGLAGLPKAPGMLGLDLLHETVPAPRERVIETYGGAVPKLPGAKAVMARAAPMRQGVVFDGWKLIVSGRKTELYYLPSDPMELLDRSGKEKQRLAKLEERIGLWDRHTEKGEPTLETLDGDDLKALESLGYLD